MADENVTKREGYQQVVVWPGTLMGDNTPTDFEQFFKEKGFDVQYLECVLTKPDMKDGEPVPDTGGRSDLLFAVHEDSIMKFATWRMAYGMRWLEDATSDANGYQKNPIYPERILEYRCWNADG